MPAINIGTAFAAAANAALGTTLNPAFTPYGRWVRRMMSWPAAGAFCVPVGGLGLH